MLLLSGCAEQDTPATAGISGLQVIVAAQSADGCTPTTNGKGDFPTGVNRFELKLTGGAEAFTATLFEEDRNNRGEILVEHVPPGENYTLDLYGCTDGEVTWSGRASGVTVEAGAKTAPRLFFTAKNKFSCTGSAEADENGWKASMVAKRAFHEVVATRNGRLLLVGGFNAYVPAIEDIDQPALLRVTGNARTISEYDPTRGLFRDFNGELSSPRGLHSAIAFDNGKKVVVLGGLTRVALQSAPFAPLTEAPEPGSTTARPAEVAELINYETGEVTPLALGLNPKPLSTIAASPNGLTIVVSGGIQNAEGDPSNALEFVAGTVTEIASGTAQPVFDRKLEVQRLGHSATFFGGGDILILGGNFGTTKGSRDTDPNNLAEVIFADGFTPTRVTIEGDFIPEPIALHQTLLASSNSCEHDFIISGGTEIKRSGQNNRTSYISPSKSSDESKNFEPYHLYAFHLNACDPAAPTGKFADVSEQFDAVRVRRVFHSLTRISDDLVMVSGGYNQLFAPGAGASELCVNAHKDTGCYLADVLLMNLSTSASGISLSPTSVGSVAFSTSRFGHRVTVLADGTALASGGVIADEVNEDAEIFNALSTSEKDACAQ